MVKKPYHNSQKEEFGMAFSYDAGYTIYNY